MLAAGFALRRFRTALLLLIGCVAGVTALHECVGRGSLRVDPSVPQRVALLDDAVIPPPPAQDLPPPPLQELEGGGGATDDSFGPRDEGPPAIDQDLGVEGEGEAGFDSFGLRAKRGGRDILLDVPHGHGASDVLGYKVFANKLAAEIATKLRAVPDLRSSSYALLVRVWVDDGGRIARCELLGGSGQRDVDVAVQRELTRGDVCVGAPPPDFPNPVVLEVRSKTSSASAR
jgi:protein TonB